MELEGVHQVLTDSHLDSEYFVLRDIGPAVRHQWQHVLDVS